MKPTAVHFMFSLCSRSENRRRVRRRVAFMLGVMLFWARFAIAGVPAISIELNRLDEQGGGCRASFVISNPEPDGFNGFKLDLVVFDRGGTIARRLAADVAPLRPQKISVKIFDIPETPCSGIGSILINDVLDCRDRNGGAVADCVARIATASKLPISLMK